MTASVTPPLVQVLARLADDWHRCRRRLSYLDLSKETPEHKEAEHEEADEAYHLRPFSDFCDWIIPLTGLDKEELREAAKIKFSGQQAIVSALRKLDGDPAIDELYAKLIQQHPAIAAKCGLQTQPDKSGEHQGAQNSKQDVALDDVTMAKAKEKYDYLQTLGTLNTTVQGWMSSPLGAGKRDQPPITLPATSAPTQESGPPDTTAGADKKKKIIQRQPDNVNVRDLCKLLEQNQAQIRAKSKTELGVAREFTKEQIGDCPRAENLLRQARRYPHLWKTR